MKFVSQSLKHQNCDLLAQHQALFHGEVVLISQVTAAVYGNESETRSTRLQLRTGFTYHIRTCISDRMAGDECSGVKCTCTCCHFVHGACNEHACPHVHLSPRRACPRGRRKLDSCCTTYTASRTCTCRRLSRWHAGKHRAVPAAKSSHGTAGKGKVCR